jgi:L,D-peptidoglycan transpeptidase YkuD (ErfK/YbiS/YcfS/YnhG family)
MRLLAFLAVLLSPLSHAFELPAKSSQCLVGIADGWNSSTVTLTLYDKKDGRWVPAGPAWSGRLGKSGLVWGLGLHPNPKGVAIKQEGDMRSPAGVFDLGGVWGYEKSVRKHPALPYRQVTSRDLWVEDPASPSYNRNVILDREPASAWEKKQQMKQDDYAHALKLFIAHNAPPKVIPNAGSSIFFHIWRADGGKPSAGCTTMPEAKLRQLISAIDPNRRPLYVLLPKADYAARKAEWKLP